MLPPFLRQNNFLSFFNFLIFSNNKFCKLICCIPDFNFVLLKILLLLRLTFEIEIEPHCELSLEHQKMWKIIMINAGKYDQHYLIVCEIAFFLKLSDFLSESFNIMNFALLFRIRKFISNHFFLLIKISVTFFPRFNFFKDFDNVVSWVLKSFATV